MSACSHTMVFHGMCADCGRHIAGIEEKDRAVTKRFQGKQKQSIDIGVEAAGAWPFPRSCV